MKVKVLECDTVTIGGRIYPRDEIENAIEKFKEKYTTGMVCSIHPADNPSTELTDASHIVNDIELDGNHLMADIHILEKISSGQMLKSMVESGGFRWATTGLGTIDENDDGNFVVKDYELRSVNLVRDYEETERQSP